MGERPRLSHSSVTLASARAHEPPDLDRAPCGSSQMSSPLDTDLLMTLILINGLAASS